MLEGGRGKSDGDGDGKGMRRLQIGGYDLLLERGWRYEGVLDVSVYYVIYCSQEQVEEYSVPETSNNLRVLFCAF